jgi:hypothetical protein
MLEHLNFPFLIPKVGDGNTKFSKFWYLETPSSSNYTCEALELIRKYNIFIDVELPISTNEIIRTNLRVHKKLDVNNSPITKYTIQYEDTNNNSTIRADNGHTFPHIDLQLPNKQKEKRIFDTDPEDYEANLVLINPNGYYILVLFQYKIGPDMM